VALFRRSSGESRNARASKQTITFKGPLELRDGHPVLDEAMRADLQRRGVDPAQVEAALGNAPGGTKRLFSLNENGVKGTFEIKDGRLVLTDASRAELEQEGVNADQLESRFQSRVSVNEKGEPVPLASPPVAAGGPQPESEPARPFYRKPSEDDLLNRRGSS
jgi:hypothetical protein